ncbi:MAG: hypothetical protein M1320_02065 [Patescibacteria group bacterium]|nr:hypothetical protein [Patescibacteria group bacterium]
MKRYTLFILIVLEVILALFVYVRFGDVAYNGDALYEAQVARNIISGKGYTTSEMPLYAVDLYQKEGLSLKAPWVNAHKFPLPVYLKLILILLLGNSLATVTFVYSYIFHFLTVLLIYFFALRLWPKNHIFAFLSAFIFLINPVLGFGTPYIMISGLTLGVDAFFFILFLYILHRWWEHRTPPLLFLGGIVSGIAFLDRYNSGLYIVAVFLALAYVLVYKRDRGLSLKDAGISFIKSYSVYFSGFAIIAALFLIWNEHVTGHLFLSINGLFQLLFDTKYNSFIDPWYKFEYIFPTSNPLGFALLHPLPLVLKWFKYAALDVVRFVSFENVLWWTPLVLSYFVLKRQITQTTRSINFILLLVISLAVLQIVALPFWAGSIAYFFYLFAPFSFVVAYALCYLYEKRGLAKPGIIYGKDILHKVLHAPVSDVLRYCFLALLFASSLILLIYTSSTVAFRSLSVRSYLVILFTICVVGGVVVMGYVSRKYILPLFVVLGFGYFIIQTGVLTAPAQAEILRDRWDLEDNPNTVHVLESLSAGGVSLSITPWNTVWWSNNKLSALPLPEYPDEIYLLENNYNQSVDSLYLNKISLYPLKYISYAWSAYARAIQYRYGFSGFRVIQETPSGLILGKDTETSFGISGDSIDFGKDSANSHLIWGWGENKIDGGRDYVSTGQFDYLQQAGNIVQGTRTDEKKISTNNTVTVPDIVVEEGSNQQKWYAKPNAEITFLAPVPRAYRAMELTVRSKRGEVDMCVILNGNLLYRDQPGVDVGMSQLSDTWKTITILLPQENIVNGLNKLSFVFSGVPTVDGTFADFDSIKFIR